ncbi:cryptochrome/photolyase family protein [Amorphus orientalis]|uniref:Deoxyribodipyrimidine photolyase-related protein n=1 Tax=Amorphus orientalis TaxID=649198 RepID=A0AAE4ATG4_9HYPH|nr:cryptochrome/photolyase family protein [Amorphus orientalis]MDQ0316137.1 deoxyribodipyrimidine photolyase-related protein [Amorphus orientalis]
MSALRLVLGDQLDRQISSLSDIDPAADTVLMAEVEDEATYVRHHKQKIAFVFAAMRHFARDLEEAGISVRYQRLDDRKRASSLKEAVRIALSATGASCLVVTEPGEWRLLQDMQDWEDDLGVSVEIREDDRFFASHAHFERHAKGRKTLRMEYFYREMRKSTGILMDGNEPAGGEWNYDKENRESLPDDIDLPSLPQSRPDEMTRAVIDLVEARFSDHFGDLHGFAWPVTRRGALAALDRFITERLPSFGTYQDAMAGGEPFVFHAVLSPLINIGLLRPQEVCERAEQAYKDGDAPLNAVEGFIRQILGWREFIRGIYWLKGPNYGSENALDARRPLPDFYWTGETDLACLGEAIGATKAHAYAHHIQRLMVTGNFALLAGIDPRAVQEWYLIVYADAYEWVELPNVHGMALFADGGVFASKPYAASGSYIDRMSDYCGGCRFDVKQKTGPEACPFNYLYWDFIARNESHLAGNRRMAMIYKSLERMDPDKVQTMRKDAAAFLDEVCGTN